MVNYNKEDLEDHEAIAAVIKNNKGEILMLDHVKYGFWTIVIGKAKHGQDSEGGMKQEVFEEVGIIVLGCKRVSRREVDYIRNEKKVKVIANIFEITKYSGKIENKEPEKHRKIEFMDIEKIKKLPYLSNDTIKYLEILGFKREARI